MSKCDFSQIRIVDIANIPSVSVRLRNCLLDTSDNIYFPIKTISDFLDAGVSAKTTFLRKVVNMGLKSFNELDRIISTVVEINDGEYTEPNSALMSDEDKRFCDAIKSLLSSSDKIGSGADPELADDEILSLSLSDVINFNEASVRLRNSILKAEEYHELPFLSVGDYLKEGAGAARKMLEVPNLGRGTALELDALIDTIISKNKIILSDSKGGEGKEQIRIEEYRPENPEDYILQQVETFLSEKERTVLYERYGVNGSERKTLEEISWQFSVTRERVRQIETKALQKLGRAFKNDGLNVFNDYYSIVIIDELFASTEFLSKNTIHSQIKTKPAWLRIYFDASYGGYGDFLSAVYKYSAEYMGWFLSGQVYDECRQNEHDTKSPFIDIEDAISKSCWPIRLSALSKLMRQPVCVSEDKINSDKNYSLRVINDVTYVHVKSVTLKNMMRFILRKHGCAMMRDEIKSECLSMFGRELSIGQVGNTLGDMEDALIVGRGAYNLYENMKISDDSLSFIRSNSEEFLFEKQDYISSKKMIRDLRTLHPKAHILHSLNGYSLLGILQDDLRFDCRRGFMIGLHSDKFSGKFTDLESEIMELMCSKGKPISLKEIVHELSERRELIVPSLKNMLDGNDLFSLESQGAYGLADMAGTTHKVVSDSIDDSILLDWDI